MLKITRTRNGVRITVKVHARASCEKVNGLQNGALNLYVTAPPVGGKANEACVRLIAKVLGVSRNNVSLISGLTSKTKVVEVIGVTREDVLKILGLEGGGNGTKGKNQRGRGSTKRQSKQ